jgi:transposase InsO family protein
VILTALTEAQVAGARLHAACQVIGVSARTIQRWKRQPDGDDRRCGPRHRPGNALSAREERAVLALMTSAEYGSVSPKQLVPRLADDGRYLASESTMYRLRRRAQIAARRPVVGHLELTRATTVHSAVRSNQVWSWDITYLPTVIHGRFLRLYLVMDVWSRRIVGWEIHDDERAEHAAALIQRICADDRLDPTGLVLHSDNGKPMRGRTMIATLQWLGIVPSFSRPHVSNDNPYSEALFRTLKHGPVYPRAPFASGEAARQWVARFVHWYNVEHRHSAIRFVTPDQRHAGVDVALLARRRALYDRARRRTPSRWSGPLRNWTPVATVVLNPASTEAAQVDEPSPRRQLP